MPARSRVLYFLMPKATKKQLIERAKRRRNIGFKWVQTGSMLIGLIMRIILLYFIDPWVNAVPITVFDNPNF